MAKKKSDPAPTPTLLPEPAAPADTLAAPADPLAASPAPRPPTPLNSGGRPKPPRSGDSPGPGTAGTDTAGTGTTPIMMATAPSDAGDGPAQPVAPSVAQPVLGGEYTVVARRYRPQQLSDLIGQEHVAAALRNALTSGRVAHAYLFTGARGVGKTSTARILAKCLNCVTGPTPTPCDACDICQSIAVGDDVDVLEIDGASNNKVEEIRDLRSNVGFRPTRARYKIYIIDEVHMLSTSAFNALLKTLEEPPPHVKFIFATTEVHKIPITILSRCQRFDFAQVSTRKIFETLRHIVAKEGLQADDDALQLVAKRAGGSLRDSQSLLDQLLAFSTGRLTAAQVHQLFGTASEDRVIALAGAILRGDTRAALDQIADAADRGLQVPELLDQLIEHWRGLMLLLTAGPNFRELPGTPAYHQALGEQAQLTNLDTILAGLDVLTTAKTRLRGTAHGQVLVEMTAIRLARLGELLSVGQLAAALAGGPPVTLTGSSSRPGPASARPAHSPTAHPTPVEADSDSAKKKQNPAGDPALTRDSTRPDTEEVLTHVDDTTLPELWSRLIEKLGPIRGGQLRQVASPAILGPNSLAIRVPTDYSALRDDDKTLEMIRLGLKRITGQEWQAVVQVAPNVTPLAGAAPTAKPTEPNGLRAKDLMQLPLFQAAAELLGAQLVRVDEGFNPGIVAPAES